MKKTLRKSFFGLLTVLLATAIWVGIQYAGWKPGGIEAGIFILFVSWVFSKATGLGILATDKDKTAVPKKEEIIFKKPESIKFPRINKIPESKSGIALSNFCKKAMSSVVDMSLSHKLIIVLLLVDLHFSMSSAGSASRASEGVWNAQMHAEMGHFTSNRIENGMDDIAENSKEAAEYARNAYVELLDCKRY